MKIIGIVSEYNPFHNGHKYHIEESKKKSNATHVIAVMSGNFVQRGECAIQNKWLRASCAVKNGVDLVIELPTIFSLSSSELFAFGGISILNSLNSVDTVSFGAENDDIEALEKLAVLSLAHINSKNENLMRYLKQGLSFPVAREKTLIDAEMISGIEKEILRSPNNILAIEYLKSLIFLKSKIAPLPIKRFGDPYHSERIDVEISSATAIRKWIFDGNDPKKIKKLVPFSTFDSLLKYPKVKYSNYYDLIKYKILTSDENHLAKINNVAEGIEKRIITVNRTAQNLEELIDQIKTKRYTKTRINRILSQILLDIKKSDIGLMSEMFVPKYARILAFNQKGTEILKKAKENSDIPIITNLSKLKLLDSNMEKMLDFDILATNIYSMFDNSIRIGEDYYKHPEKII